MNDGLIPENLRSEERLRAAQRMETLGRLVGGAAHDMNNLLSVISGYASLLQMKLAKTGTSYKELAEIEKAALKATTLVGQLLSYSRRPPEHLRLYDLAVLIEDFIPTANMVLGEGVEVQTHFEKGLGRIKVDRSRMEQVLMNLIVNAKDAMPKGGRLTITLKANDLDQKYFLPGEAALPGRYIQLTVRDTGTGMPPQVLARALEAYFTTKSEDRASGLGLTIVSRIVQQFGGILRVESSPDLGTTFNLYFPQAAELEEEDVDDEQPRSKRPPATGETILLFEEDNDLRRLTKDILVLEGYRVLEPKTREEALGFARAESIKIQLLLADLIALEKQGGDLVEAILTHRPTIKLLCMSGEAPQSLKRRLPNNRQPSYLEMPFTPNQLSAKVRTALDGD